MNCSNSTEVKGVGRWVRRLVWTSCFSSALGFAFAIPVFLKISPIPVALFFGVAQPAIGLGILCFLVAAVLYLRTHLIP